MKKTIFKIAVPLTILVAVGIYLGHSFEEVLENLSAEPDEWDDYDER